MILGPDGKKLSKRHGATSVEEYAERGYLPDAMVNFLALLGWSLDGETTLIPRDVLAREFSLERITKKDAIFDEQKLDWMNGQYIQQMDAATWVDASADYLVAAGATPEAIAANHGWFEKLYPLVAERLVRLDEIPGKLAYMFWGPNVQLDEKSVQKVLLKEGSRAEEVLRATRDILADESREWACDPLQDEVRTLTEKLDMKAKFIFQPIRVAITGSQVSPPLFESVELMERADVLARIDATLNQVFGG